MSDCKCEDCFHKKERVFNFSAGPSTLSLDVLESAHKDFFNYKGTGECVMEMSHRSKEYDAIHKQTTADLRKLLDIPENYEVLYLQGGACGQFAGVPLNLLGDKKKADYISIGNWSSKAAKEAEKYCEVNIVCKGDDPMKATCIPPFSEWKMDPESAYLHICSNETIGGLQFMDFPEFPKDKIVVCDMSSDFLSRPIDVSKFGLIYAGAQKNVGPAGVVIVIVRKDLLGKASPMCPAVFNYTVMAKNDSMFNTCPTWAIYMAGLSVQWMLKLGGLKEVQKMNEEKAAVLYDYLESSKFFKCPIKPGFRSLMNVPFVVDLADAKKVPALSDKFVLEAKKAGMINLKGHRLVGGMRASIYNAFPKAGVEKLVSFMKEFEAAHKE